MGDLELLIPEKQPREGGNGCPRINNRDILNGILWELRTGAVWQDLPDLYPSPATFVSRNGGRREYLRTSCRPYHKLILLIEHCPTNALFHNNSNILNYALSPLISVINVVIQTKVTVRKTAPVLPCWESQCGSNKTDF